MSRPLGLFAIAALAGAAVLLPGPTLAFNPQPDPPGKHQSKSLGGPDTKAAKGGKGSWRGFHEVDEKSKWKSIHEVDEKTKTKGSKSLPAVQKHKP